MSTPSTSFSLLPWTKSSSTPSTSHSWLSFIIMEPPQLIERIWHFLLPHWHVNWCCNVHLVLQATILLVFHMRHYLAPGILFLWILQISLALSPTFDFPSDLGVGIALQMYWLELAPQSHLLSNFWPVVHLCTSLYVFWKGASLMRITLLWV